MGKILSKYENDLDKVWYDSSNILYSECDDKENELKTVRVTFKNGSTYEYYDIKVNDYLLFREDASNGKAFYKYIKNHEFKKLDNRDVDVLKNELYELLEEANTVQENEEENNNS